MKALAISAPAKTEGHQISRRQKRSKYMRSPASASSSWIGRCAGRTARDEFHLGRRSKPPNTGDAGAGAHLSSRADEPRFAGRQPASATTTSSRNSSSRRKRSKSGVPASSQRNFGLQNHNPSDVLVRAVSRAPSRSRHGETGGAALGCRRTFSGARCVLGTVAKRRAEPCVTGRGGRLICWPGRDESWIRSACS